MLDSHIPPAEKCSYPVRHGNRIRPLIDGEAAFRRICEAVENAHKSVWVTVAFISENFRMPDGRGTLFDVLQTAKSRGIDVKVIFWRSPELEQTSKNMHFHGQDYQREQLSDAGYDFHARWDYLPRGKCHHQKSWLVDAGQPTEVGFVGGINLGVNDVAPVGHRAREGGSTHDIYCEITGPSVTDVHHNFVQRWNEASEQHEDDGSWPHHLAQGNLPFPTTLSAATGNIPVQVSRTVRREQYSDSSPAIDAAPFPIEAGEKSTFEQYLAAIKSAERTIYIEDQVIASYEAMTHLEAALQRGVKVVFLVPGNPNWDFMEARRTRPDLPMYALLNQLASYENFTLAAICSRFEDGRYCEIYVHAKTAIVDDHWATIGSCNFADRSFHSDTEMNVTFWDNETARQFRLDLFAEHLGIDVSGYSDARALDLFRDTARQNALKKARAESLSGLAYQIDPRQYGV